MLYALCSMLYVLCFISFSVIKAWNNTMSKSMKNPEKVCQRMGLCSMLYALCLRKPAEARGSPQKPTEARGSPDFVDNFLRLFRRFFLQLYLFCFICSTKFVNAVQKSVAVFEGGVGEGGPGCVCVKAILWTACCCQKDVGILKCLFYLISFQGVL